MIMAFRASSISCKSFLFWFLLFPQLHFSLPGVSNYHSGNLHAFLLFLSFSALMCCWPILPSVFCVTINARTYPSAPWSSCNDIYSCLLKYCLCIKSIIKSSSVAESFWLRYMWLTCIFFTLFHLYIWWVWVDFQCM